MVGLVQESIASLGPMCCALTPVCNPPRGGKGVVSRAVDLALSLELAYSNGPCPQVRRAVTVVASTSALGTLAAVEGKAANHNKINMACCKAILGVSLLSGSCRASAMVFSTSSLGCRLPKVRQSKKKPLVTFFKVPRVLSLFILLKQANARFSKPLQLPN
jgi:hypothetical protein